MTDFLVELALTELQGFLLCVICLDEPRPEGISPKRWEEITGEGVIQISSWEIKAIADSTGYDVVKELREIEKNNGKGGDVYGMIG